MAKRTLCGPERTLSSLAAVHCEVGGLVGLQAHLLHTWTINLHVLWMATLPNRHLGNRNHSQAGYFLSWKQKLGSVCVYPEGTVGDIDISPGDDDGVFDGLRGDIDTEEGSVSVVCILDVDGETLGILKTATHPHQQSQCASLGEDTCRSSQDTFEDKRPVEPTETPEQLFFADVSNVSSNVSGGDPEVTGAG